MKTHFLPPFFCLFWLLQSSGSLGFRFRGLLLPGGFERIQLIR